jgi:hypothetical protein
MPFAGPPRSGGATGVLGRRARGYHAEGERRGDNPQDLEYREPSDRGCGGWQKDSCESCPWALHVRLGGPGAARARRAAAHTGTYEEPAWRQLEQPSQARTA